MTTHLICITETRDFVYEVEIPIIGIDEFAQGRARGAALQIHAGRDVSDPFVTAVSCFRARPIKRTAEWVAHRDGSV